MGRENRIGSEKNGGWRGKEGDKGAKEFKEKKEGSRRGLV